MLYRRPRNVCIPYRLGKMEGDLMGGNRWKLWQTEFESPVLLASGTAGFGLELQDLNCLEGVAAVVSKATTLEPREGNPPPRIIETRFGLLNSIGLANPGVREVVDSILPRAFRLPVPLIVNVAGKTAEEYVKVVEILETSQVPFGYEVNVSCPNVEEGGRAFGASPDVVRRVAEMVAGVSRRPFSVKLTPNEGSIVDAAIAAQSGGASAVTVCNTFLGMKMDWKTGRTPLALKTGGYSSPALLPLTVARVYSVSGAVDIPVLASGGVSRPEDILELLAAGASMVQVGSWLMRRPSAALELLEGVRSMSEEVEL
ncbi:MAG: dihydroorotate dehydrogenase [Candidatus Aegiribacteria sp.]|nr:dihydroorotate dehydrogenase [Candidatus Aegiribacteria sp.]MBD3295356.1 dihydroorotate dehydrogenase [Candidatus Fermentibacteria bacterium]